jgi:hypothetical protein
MVRSATASTGTDIVRVTLTAVALLLPPQLGCENQFMCMRPQPSPTRPARSTSPPVEPGTYALTITAGGFTDRKTTVSVVSGENPPLPPAVLQVAPAVSKVDVGLSQHELAVEQVHAEEKQRFLGVFPNFFVSYQPNARL